MNANVDPPLQGDVVVGCNSKLWRAASGDPRIAGRFRRAIGHRELAHFSFGADDRVWVFAYSRVPAENSRLLGLLRAAGVREVIYVSSAATIVTGVTRCYEYPRVKKLAEDEAARLPGARILTLGIVCATPAEQPAGITMITSQAQLNDFLLRPDWPDDGGRRKLLFGQPARPFTSKLELVLYRMYGILLRAAGPWPCLLRPVDWLLRALGLRWYGYVYIGERLWNSTRS